MMTSPPVPDAPAPDTAADILWMSKCMAGIQGCLYAAEVERFANRPDEALQSYQLAIEGIEAMMVRVSTSTGQPPKACEHTHCAVVRDGRCVMCEREGAE